MKANKRSKPEDMFAKAARQAVRKAGWSPHYDLEILTPDGQASSKPVRYGYRADKVRLMQTPDLFPQVTQALDVVPGAGLGRPIDAFNDVVASRVYLQVGSFKVCPYSAYDYAEILEACADGLRSAGANEPEVSDFMVPVTSFFIASVVAGVYGIEGPDPGSFRCGWALDHIISSMSRGAALESYIAIYANVQLRLWSDNRKLTEAVRTRFPQPFDALEFETDRGVAILLDTFEYADCDRDGLAWREDEQLGELIVNELKYGWRTWAIKAFSWAELMAPYIIADQQDRQPPPQPQANQGSRGQRPSEQARQRRETIRPPDMPNIQTILNRDGVSSHQLPGTPADPFAERLATDSWFRQQVMQSGIGRGKNPLDYFMGFDALDALYRSRATDIKIEAKVTRRQGMAFEIAHMTREELGSCLPGLNSIDWGATRFGPGGKLQLYEKKMPITDHTPARLQMGGLPDLLFIVDSSGSMRWNPKTGTGSYDSLLRAVWSVFHFLEKHNKAQYMQFAVVNFSAATLTTPWLPFADLRKIKKLLFKHQSGGTVLDCPAVQKVAAANSDRFLCLMITDAQIGNAQQVLDTIKTMADRGHGFVLIQIGRPSKLANQVREIGLPVHVITDHRELQGLCLDYARKTW